MTGVRRSMQDEALREERVLLTRDRLVTRSCKCDQAYLVRADCKREQLKEIVAAFDIALDSSSLLSRCYFCNGAFRDTKLRPEELPPGCGVPAGVRETVSEFWCCSQCDKAYWQGRQFTRTMSTLAGRIDALRVAPV